MGAEAAAPAPAAGLSGPHGGGDRRSAGGGLEERRLLPRAAASPDEWLFQTGLAYPVRAEIQGRGVGRVRTCEFSTGPFVEPIEVWDEPRLLRFR